MRVNSIVHLLIQCDQSLVLFLVTARPAQLRRLHDQFTRALAHTLPLDSRAYSLARALMGNNHVQFNPAIPDPRVTEIQHMRRLYTRSTNSGAEDKDSEAFLSLTAEWKWMRRKGI